jgi:hypothetical protein
VLHQEHLEQEEKIEAAKRKAEAAIEPPPKDIAKKPLITVITSTA